MITEKLKTLKQSQFAWQKQGYYEGGYYDAWRFSYDGGCNCCGLSRIQFC